MNSGTASRGRNALAVTAIAAAIGVTVLAFAMPGHSPRQPFPALAPARAPAGWQHATLPGGSAVLSYPPALRPLAGDKNAVSAARLSAGGTFELYLNATPRQGAEHRRNWAAFRLRLLRSGDAASAREIAAAGSVKFVGGTGSCVLDDYVTRIGAHHYEEIACLVRGRTSASVLVAAAPAASWDRAGPLLRRAVAAYRVR